MQNLIVILIVVIAAIYVGRVFYRGFVQKKNCACGCSGCDITDSCQSVQKEPASDATDRQRPA